MATTSDIRKGLCIKYNHDIYKIIEFLHVKPGKGPAFVRTKLKSVTTGKVIDNTFSAGHKIEDVRVEKINPQHKGFGFTKREDSEEFSIPGFNLDEELKKHFIEDREYLFIKNQEPIFPIGSKIHNKTTELESLPIAFYGKPISTSSNRANGNFSIHGKMYKPVLGVRVDAPQNPPTKEFEIKGTTHNSTNH